MDGSKAWTSDLATLGILLLGLSSRLLAADAGDALPFDPPSGEVAELVTIFNTGFESGDSSDWSDTTPNSCPAPTGGPTLHANAVAPNEIWTAEGSPHILTGNVTVPPGVTLTVSPCAELRLRSNVNLYIQGTLAARGTPLRRITIHRDDPALLLACAEFRDRYLAPLFGGLGHNDLLATQKRSQFILSRGLAFAGY